MGEMEDGTPLVLIGLNREDGKLAVVGLYKTLKDVQDAIGSRLPIGVNYAVMTPKIGNFVQPIPFPANPATAETKSQPQSE